MHASARAIGAPVVVEAGHACPCSSTGGIFGRLTAGRYCQTLQGPPAASAARTAGIRSPRALARRRRHTRVTRPEKRATKWSWPSSIWTSQAGWLGAPSTARSPCRAWSSRGRHGPAGHPRARRRERKATPERGRENEFDATPWAVFGGGDPHDASHRAPSGARRPARPARRR